ncbi:hypothetical protein O2N63_05645 [Aliiroseovarius sp. KMU-50]|uniref:Glutamine amidotransferase domain-containing protein n=1 Tax=Aliiroseovarius salicola TaxID=3009082 RepID=A0ABT4VZ89_9RHOB|nr:hypothetical protein [Aliiroseovarius sp. KMU-50]MDA5093569.1 hypothetical protein [Aliiroseovarius sp. KMU-50]
MTETLFFTPLVPWAALVTLSVLSVLALLLAIWQGLVGWMFRAIALIAVLVALAGPSLQEETRDPLPDILLVMVDETASQSLPGRSARRDAALNRLREAAAAQSVELVVKPVPDAANGQGSLLAPALDQALADIPRAQLAGVVILSDGVFHDAARLGARFAELPAPAHLMQTGSRQDWDRRLTITQAPRFAVTGEEVRVHLRVDALGSAPAASARLSLSIDGDPASHHDIPVGLEMELPLVLDHAGETVVHLMLEPLEGELTDRNNQAALRINGIRDRLRVLLISGEPHPGTRTWRNLLKSDASVDLVHFTILRPPEKQDGVPVNELSLIPFPTQELFVEKIDEFDLIIFDRYRLRGILPGAYLESVRRYVERGGAVLVAAGPEFASVESLSRSPLGEVLPARPSGQVISSPMRPELTDTGRRHPVTQGLSQSEGAPTWGAWLRHLELEPDTEQVVMQTPDGGALMALSRVAEGRVALIGSDQVWLWARGYDGGGPQLELLRRLAHWMMGEPELEEEALNAEETPEGDILVTRQTLADEPAALEVEAPDGNGFSLQMQSEGGGRFSALLSNENYADAPLGVYRFSQGDQQAVAIKGDAAPVEFADPLPRDDMLRDLTSPTGGGVWALEDGMPRLRRVRVGQRAIGNGWIGYTPRDAFVSRDLRVRPALPAWIWLMVAAGALVLGWWFEGRRSDDLEDLTAKAG